MKKINKERSNELFNGAFLVFLFEGIEINRQKLKGSSTLL